MFTNPLVVKNQITDLTEISSALHRGSDHDLRGAWEAAENIMVLWEFVHSNDEKSLKLHVDLELKFNRWLLSVPEASFPSTISAVETLGAIFVYDSDNGTTTPLDEGKFTDLLGPERLQREPFLAWFSSQIPICNIENGHLLLAKKLDEASIYHAGKSGDRGIAYLVWEKVGRNWEWMVSRGFTRAAQELIALCIEEAVKTGEIILQWAFNGQESVAFGLGRSGIEELAASLRGIAPAIAFSGRVEHEYDQLYSCRMEGKIYGRVVESRFGEIVAIGGDGLLNVWNPTTGAVERSFPLKSVRNGVSAWDGRWVVTGSLEVVDLEGVDDIEVISETLEADLLPSGQENQAKEVIDVWFMNRSTVLILFPTVLCVARRSQHGGQWVVDPWFDRDFKLVHAAEFIEKGPGSVMVHGYHDLWILELDTSGKLSVASRFGAPASRAVPLADGRILVASMKWTLYLWDPSKRRRKQAVVEHEGWSNRRANSTCWLALTRQGQVIQTNHAGTMELLDVDAKTVVSHIPNLFRAFTVKVYSLSSGTVLAARNSTGTLHPPPSKWIPASQASGSPTAFTAALLPDNRVVVGGFDTHVVIWSPLRGGVVPTVQSRLLVTDENNSFMKGPVRRIIPVQGGDMVICGGDETVRRFHEAEDGAWMRVWTVADMGERRGCLDMAYLAARHVVVVAEDTRLALLDGDTGKILGRLPVECWALAPIDDDRVAVGGLGDVSIVNVATQQVEREWQAHDRWITTLISVDKGNSLLSSSLDRTIQLLSVREYDITTLYERQHNGIEVVGDDGLYVCWRSHEAEAPLQLRSWKTGETVCENLIWPVAGGIEYVMWSADTGVLVVVEARGWTAYDNLRLEPKEAAPTQGQS